MPITQARMITLINAALDYQQALDKSISKIASEVRLVHTGKRTAREALDEISMFCGERSWLLAEPIIADVTISTERAHFAANMRKNEASRKWQEAQRRASGVPLRSDTSTSSSLFLPATPRQYPVVASHLPATSHHPPADFRDESEPDFGFDPDLFQPSSDDSTAGSPEISLPLHSTLSPKILRDILIEETANSEHHTTVHAAATFEEDLLICRCGFKGLFQQWQQHLTEGEGARGGNQ